LLRAAIWVDANDNANRAEAARILARPEYVGADFDVIAASMTGTFEYERGDKRPVPDFNVFFREFATYPYYSDAIWYLTQMRRWGQIEEGKPDEWYHDVARSVYRPDIYLEAAKQLVGEGLADRDDFPWGSDGYRPPAGRLHRRHRLRRAQTECLSRAARDRVEGRRARRRHARSVGRRRWPLKPQHCRRRRYAIESHR